VNKDIFVMMDTSRVKAFLGISTFVPRNNYEYEGISLISHYEWGCFKSGDDRIRIILCSGSSMTVEQFCHLWKTIYPKESE
jgi:hypothetical protein